jgi:hypothetical protein
VPIPVFVVIASAVALCQGVCAATGFHGPEFDRYDIGMFGLALVLCHPGVRRRYSLFAPFMTAFQVAVLLCYAGTSVAIALPYAVQTFNNPYQDAAFIAFDRALGFDYSSFIIWITSYPKIYVLLGIAYQQFARAAVLTLLFGMIFYRDRQIGTRFTAAFYIALMLATIVSGLYPCEGAVILLDPATAQLVTGASPLNHLRDLRSGVLLHLPDDIRGIISFPSMHVGLGLLMIYYTKGTKLFYLASIPALLFIVTAVTHGAHYLADCFAAVPIVVVACVLTESLFRYHLAFSVLRHRIIGLRRAT